MNQSQLSVGVQRPVAMPRDQNPSVIIVSDVVLYREGLHASLVRDGRLNVIDLVGSHAALPVISRTPPDAVLLDGGVAESLSLARRIRANVPTVRIVGFGIAGDADRLVACAESGLTAFVDRDGSFDELVTAVLGAFRGELACSPKVSALLCERLAHLAAAGQRPEELTRRERQIAVLIGEGLSNKEIANDLRIGPSTVKNHVHNILEKLNVRRRAAIVHQLKEFPWMNRNQVTGG